MASAGDIINGALRLIGVLAEGETPSAETSQDALAAMNQMIDSWNTERLSVYATQDQVFTWPAGQTVQTLGPSGDFVGNRPVLLDDSTYYNVPGTGVSYTVQFINEAEYNAIAVKSVSSNLPMVLFTDMTHPNVTMHVYPRPSAALEWHFISAQELTQPATLATELAFPPGYLRAFRYNLASELAPEFGVEPSPTVVRIAMTSKRNLKRINNPNDLMDMPPALSNARDRFNIYSGNF